MYLPYRKQVRQGRNSAGADRSRRQSAPYPPEAQQPEDYEYLTVATAGMYEYPSPRSRDLEDPASLVFFTADAPMRPITLLFGNQPFACGHMPTRLAPDLGINHCYYKTDDSARTRTEEWLTLIGVPAPMDVTRGGGLDGLARPTGILPEAQRADLRMRPYGFLSERYRNNFASGPIYDMSTGYPTYQQQAQPQLHQPIAPILYTVQLVVPANRADEVQRWYETEHLELISRIPGWQRSRRFQLLPELGWGNLEIARGHVELLSVHEFEANNGLGEEDHLAARATAGRRRIDSFVVARRKRIWQYERSMDPVIPTGL